MSPLRFQAAGALTDEHIYIERPADREALECLLTMDYLTVIEPRQQGKTSLFNHLVRQPTLSGMTFVYIDVTRLDRTSEAGWYETLYAIIWPTLFGSAPEPSNTPRTKVDWDRDLHHIASWAQRGNQHIAIALDEIGAATFPGAAEFFGILRAIHSSRHIEGYFKNLTFLLIGAFRPHNLINDVTVSPFNIAKRVHLPDFTLDQVIMLMRNGEWTHTEALAQRVHYWTDGQPYLTQLLSSYLKTDATLADVDLGVEQIHREDMNHLPSILRRFGRDKRLRSYVELIQASQIKFYPGLNPLQADLELLGLIKANSEGYCIIRNRIYEQALKNADLLASSKIVDLHPKPTSIGTRLKLLPEEQARLYDLMETSFDTDELHELCLDLGVHYDDIKGNSRTNKIRELIAYQERRGQIAHVLEICARKRPDLDWYGIFSDPSSE